MKPSQHHFRFYHGNTIVETIYNDFTAARRIGDRLADERGRIALYCFNEAMRLWQHMGDFLGSHRFVSSLGGEEVVISADYTSLIRKGVQS